MLDFGMHAHLFPIAHTHDLNFISFFSHPHDEILRKMQTCGNCVRYTACNKYNQSHLDIVVQPDQVDLIFNLFTSVIVYGSLRPIINRSISNWLHNLCLEVAVEDLRSTLPIPTNADQARALLNDTDAPGHLRGPVKRALQIWADTGTKLSQTQALTMFKLDRKNYYLLYLQNLRRYFSCHITEWDENTLMSGQCGKFQYYIYGFNHILKFQQIMGGGRFPHKRNSQLCTYAFAGDLHELKYRLRDTF